MGRRSGWNRCSARRAWAARQSRKTSCNRAAAAEGRLLLPYLAAIFESVSWPRWLMLMVPYCVLFFAIDSLVELGV